MEGLAGYAAHMLAIAHPSSEKAIELKLRGLEIARALQASKALELIPAMLSNKAWDLHDAGHCDEALELFKERLKQGRYAKNLFRSRLRNSRLPAAAVRWGGTQMRSRSCIRSRTNIRLPARWMDISSRNWRKPGGDGRDG